MAKSATLKLRTTKQGIGNFGFQLEGLSCHVVFEATGTYHRQLQTVLQNAGIAVSVVNPRQALNYAKSQNRRNKTDKVDALLLAQFGLERQPPVSLNDTSVQQSLARELAALGEDLGRLRNRLEAAQRGLAHPDVVISLERRISLLEQENKALSSAFKMNLNRRTLRSLGCYRVSPVSAYIVLVYSLLNSATHGAFVPLAPWWPLPV